MESNRLDLITIGMVPTKFVRLVGIQGPDCEHWFEHISVYLCTILGTSNTNSSPKSKIFTFEQLIIQLHDWILRVNAQELDLCI